MRSGNLGSGLGNSALNFPVAFVKSGVQSPPKARILSNFPLKYFIREALKHTCGLVLLYV